MNCHCEVATPTPPLKWDGESHLNNFSYEDESVTVWKAYNIGGGKTIPWSQLQGNSLSGLSHVLNNVE